MKRSAVEKAMAREIGKITYGNFKSSVKDKPLHDAYMRVWSAMSMLQDPPPYSQPYRKPEKV